MSVAVRSAGGENWLGNIPSSHIIVIQILIPNSAPYHFLPLSSRKAVIEGSKACHLPCGFGLRTNCHNLLSRQFFTYSMDGKPALRQRKGMMDLLQLFRRNSSHTTSIIFRSCDIELGNRSGGTCGHHCCSGLSGFPISYLHDH